MRRWFLLACIIALVPISLAAENPNDLRLLTSGVDAHQWEAVGRIDIADGGFCSGALIAPSLVLTAAHCLFDAQTGDRVDLARIEFRAGWRSGRAAAYRGVTRSAISPDYTFGRKVSAQRVRSDVALLKLDHPIRNTTVHPFSLSRPPQKGQTIGVVSYARNRSESPSLQEVCTVLGKRESVLITSCSVDFGASGAPILSFEGGRPQIASIVSAKAEADGHPVSLGADIHAQLQKLTAQIENRGGTISNANSGVVAGVLRRDTGAKFVRVGE